jgi:large subunit ribosomal protein L10
MLKDMILGKLKNNRRTKLVALKLDQKKVVVKEVNEVASSAVSAVVANYRGLGVAGLTEMRRRALELNVYVRVVRNTLAKRAIDGTELSCLDSSLVGPVILLFSMDHPGAAAKLAKEFSKKYKMLEVTALAYDGNLMDASQLSTLADLPTHSEAIALLMGIMMAPISQTVRGMSETLGRLVRVTSAMAESKG